MILVIQRAKNASVSIDGKIAGRIEHGMVVFLGISKEDQEADLLWLAKKTAQLRIFADDEGKMNQSLQDIDGQILLISQFTLLASTKKGNRPSCINAAHPDMAIPMYERMIEELEKLTSRKVETGIFGADMQVSLTNDGPVTIVIDSKDRK